jgi:hypothetical protein
MYGHGMDTGWEVSVPKEILMGVFIYYRLRIALTPFDRLVLAV